MAKGDDLQQRLINFSVLIIKLSNKMPKNPAGRHMATQMIRSGTSSAANYGEARAAESKRDFTHKLAIVLKELNETNIWLEIIGRSGILRFEIMKDIKQECTGLSKIINASLSTIGKKN